MPVQPHLSPQTRADVISVGAVALAALALSYLSASDPKLALLLSAVGISACVIGVRPVYAGVAALPALYGFQDIGIGNSIGISDAFILVAAAFALPAVVRTPGMRATGALRRSFVVYIALLVPSLVIHYNPHGPVELVHRLVLVVLTSLVGVWLVTEGREVAALRALLAASVAFSLISIVWCVTHNFLPASPFGYNKNYLGSLISLSLLVVICLPTRLGLTASLRGLVMVVLGLGALATQSRGALLGSTLGLLIWFFFVGASHAERVISVRRARAVGVVVALVLLVFSFLSLDKQFSDKATLRTSSVGVRQAVEAYTLDLWRSSPLVGVGVRYFKTGELGQLAVASNNEIDSELAEAGVIGLGGFLLLHATVLGGLVRRRRDELGLAALAVLSGNMLHGLFDIYWSSGITSLTFVLAGMAYAARPTP